VSQEDALELRSSAFETCKAMGLIQDRTVFRPDRVIVVREELPFLPLLLPIFYLHSFLPVIIAYGINEGFALTKSENARLAALGALPVSVTCFITYPWILAFSQLAWRNIADHPYNNLANYDDSLLESLLWQYAFWPRWWRERQAARGYEQLDASELEVLEPEEAGASP